MLVSLHTQHKKPWIGSHKTCSSIIYFTCDFLLPTFVQQCFLKCQLCNALCNSLAVNPPSWRWYCSVLIFFNFFYKLLIQLYGNFAMCSNPHWHKPDGHLLVTAKQFNSSTKPPKCQHLFKMLAFMRGGFIAERFIYFDLKAKMLVLCKQVSTALCGDTILFRCKQKAAFKWQRSCH